MDESTFRITRWTQSSEIEDWMSGEVTQEGLTLEQAQAHCRLRTSRGVGWYDGYSEE